MKFDRLKRYLNVSVHGDNVRTFYTKQNGKKMATYWDTAKLPDVEFECRREIEAWIWLCYHALGREYHVTDRNVDTDIKVVVEFHRQYLTNQDSICVATCAEQIAFNNCVTRKLKSQIARLESLIEKEPQKKLVISETLRTLRLNVDKDIFFADKLARAALLFVKVCQNDKYLQLSSHLDHSIFDLEFQAAAFEEGASKRRAAKAVEKNQRLVEAALEKFGRASPQ
jgi:hypothetical protein